MVYFIEHKESQLWMSLGNKGFTQTSDPLEAAQFTKEYADKVVKHLKNYIVTEHEFVDQIKKCTHCNGSGNGNYNNTSIYGITECGWCGGTGNI